jgi:hypothetical protein
VEEKENARRYRRIKEKKDYAGIGIKRRIRKRRLVR